MSIKTTKSKTIFNRKIPLIEIERLPIKNIVRYGTGAHVTVPLFYKNKIAQITILSLQPFVCRKCNDIISNEENFSPNKNLCKICYASKRSFEDWEKLPDDKKICRDCNKKMTDEQFEENWDQDQCFRCSVDEIDKLNEENQSKKLS